MFPSSTSAPRRNSPSERIARSKRRTQPQNRVRTCRGDMREPRKRREGAPDTRTRTASARAPNRSATRAIDRPGHRPAPRSGGERRAQARRLRSEENPRVRARRQRRQKGARRGAAGALKRGRIASGQRRWRQAGTDARGEGVVTGEGLGTASIKPFLFRSEPISSVLGPIGGEDKPLARGASTRARLSLS